MSKDVSGQQIKRGLWWLDNRKKTKTILTIFFVLACLAIIVLFVYESVLYLNERLNQADYAAEIALERIDYYTILGERDPLAILINEPQAILDSQGVYDLYAKVENLNPNWYATSCEYVFSFNETRLGIEEAYFLPGETKYLVVKGYKTEVEGIISQPDVSLVINNCNWQLKSASALPAMNFEIVDQAIRQSTSLDTSSLITNQNTETDIYGFPVEDNTSLQGGALTQAYFEIINKSTYGFWEVQAIAVLETGDDDIVALYKINLGKFESFETKKITVNWPKYFSRGVTAKVYLTTNGLDENNLISLGDIN